MGPRAPEAVCTAWKVPELRREQRARRRRAPHRLAGRGERVQRGRRRPSALLASSGGDDDRPRLRDSAIAARGHRAGGGGDTSAASAAREDSRGAAPNRAPRLSAAAPLSAASMPLTLPPAPCGRDERCHTAAVMARSATPSATRRRVRCCSRPSSQMLSESAMQTAVRASTPARERGSGPRGRAPPPSRRQRRKRRRGLSACSCACSMRVCSCQALCCMCVSHSRHDTSAGGKTQDPERPTCTPSTLQPVSRPDVRHACQLPRARAPRLAGSQRRL